MSTNTYRGSAEIIPFPSRARSISKERREAEMPATKFALPRVANVAFGSGWYHEAAIQDDERTRNN
jgi:Protein of unknown function (DUF2735)